MNDEKFMKTAIELSKSAVEHGNEPFGAVLVKKRRNCIFARKSNIHKA